MIQPHLLPSVKQYLPFIAVLMAACSSFQTGQIEKLPLKELYQQGLTFYKQGDFQRAELYWKNGLDSAAKNQPLEKAQYLNGLSRVADSTGNYLRARFLAEQALAAGREARERKTESEALMHLGQAWWRLDQYDKAQEYSKKAESIAIQIGNLQIQSESSRTLGALSKDQGQFALAKTNYSRSLALAEQARDQWLQAKSLNNLGELEQRLGHYPEAKKLYQSSLLLREAIHDLAGQGSVQGNLCRWHQNMNELDVALAYCERSLSLALEIQDVQREANALNNIAGIYEKLGKLDKAEKCLLESFTIKKKSQDMAGASNTLNNLAELFRRSGDSPKALSYYEKALTLQQGIGNRSGESGTRLNIGLYYMALNQSQNALASLHRALLIQAELNEPEIIWRIQSKLSEVYRTSGQASLAIFFGKLTVNTIQSIRSHNLTLTKGQQASYLEDKRSVYEQLSNLLIDQERFLEAQQVLAMLKEEEYFDFIQRDADSDPRMTQVSLSEEEAIKEAKYKESFQLIIELSKSLSHDKELSPQLKKDLDDIRQGYFVFLNTLERDFTDAPKEFKGRNLDNIDRFQDEQSSIIQKNAVLIHYLYTNEKLRILLTQGSSMLPPIAYKVDINRTEFNQLIFKFLQKIKAHDNVIEEAEKLYSYLIEPLKKDLTALKPKTLIIYPYRALRYLPFSALYDGEKKQYLTEEYSLALFDAAADTNLTKRPKPNWHVAGFGVAQMSNEDIKKDLKNLPAVAEEIDAIVKEITPKNLAHSDGGIMEGIKYLNTDFTFDHLKENMMEDKYQVYHLASHFILMPGSFKESYLLAGNSEKIFLPRFKALGFSMKNSDLITLSACETALDVGKSRSTNMDGEEFEGFGTLLQNKGAKAVLATLWSVDDIGTAEFMEKFYALRQAKKLSKAEAIQQAQWFFLKKQADGFTDNNPSRGAGVAYESEEKSTRDYSHPYYWAPFILMGNWQ